LDAPFGYNYTWRVNSSIIANENKPTLIANQEGIYQTQLTPSWHQVKPDVTSEYLYNITFLNDFTGFVVGANGTIMRTEDSGDNWQKIYNTSTETLNDIHFTTPDDAWIVGSGGTLLKSNTSGISWESSPISINGNAIDFFDKLKGIIVGTNGNIQYTINGGQTWNLAVSGVTINLKDVKFISSNIAFAVGDGGTFIKSINGGQTWSSIFTGITFNLKRIYFFNSLIGWIVGDNDTVLRTTDGGIGWNSINTGVTINGGSILSWQDISFSNVSTGWLVDGGNTLAKTTDGGNTWAISTRFSSIYPHGVSINQASKLFFSKTSSNGFVVGWPGSIAKTNDLGVNWFAKSDGSSNSFNDVQFIDDNNVIAVGPDGFIFKSTNKGKNWTKLSNLGAINRENLQSVHFINPSKGWTLDVGGNIFTTNDGGVSWSKQRNAVSSQFFNDIIFLDSNKGFAIGGNGLFMETTNGGLNWSIRNIISNSSMLMSIYFIDSNTGWIVGSLSVGNNSIGLILKTIDGGITWQQQTSNTIYQIRKVYFVNTQIGWAYNGFVLKTVDGGNTWVEQTNYPASNVLFFKNEFEGWTASNSIVSKTNNGGTTWSSTAINLSTYPNELKMNSTNVGILVGTNNTIYRFNPNACSVTTNPINILNTILTGSAILSGTTSVSPFTYQSGVSINSTQSITEGFNIDYKAKNVIDLQPGFDIKPQTFFKAEMKGCNN
jgi:photosystem II stability/assembly factor-like uncharacterized protein